MNSLAAILGAGLVGIDKTNQDGYNYVKMAQNYFNSDTGWNIVMNNTTSSVGSKGGVMVVIGGMMYYLMLCIMLYVMFFLV